MKLSPFNSKKLIVYTLGTSNRSKNEFISILEEYGIKIVVDVRRFPLSRFSHFKKENLEKLVGRAGMKYFYLGDLLGGYRKPNFETYMTSARYYTGLKQLEKIGRKAPTAFICAERLPWKCHRQLIGSTLKRNGWEVIHLTENGHKHCGSLNPYVPVGDSATIAPPLDRSRLDFTKTEVLIIAKTYPTPSRRYQETVCTGGITRQGDLVRLYPIPFRYLAEDARYKTFTWINVGIRKSHKDTRKESHEIDVDSIKIGKHIHSKNWEERWRHLKDAIAPDLETLSAMYAEDRTSMGLIEIVPTHIYWREEKSRDWTQAQKEVMAQMQLLGPERPSLEKLPHKIKIQFKCKRNPKCNGHDQTILIWDYYEAFRKFTIQYGGEITALQKIKERIEALYFDQNYEVYAVVGTHFRFKVWILGALMRFSKIRQEPFL